MTEKKTTLIKTVKVTPKKVNSTVQQYILRIPIEVIRTWERKHGPVRELVIIANEDGMEVKVPTVAERRLREAERLG